MKAAGMAFHWAAWRGERMVENLADTMDSQRVERKACRRAAWKAER